MHDVPEQPGFTEAAPPETISAQVTAQDANRSPAVTSVLRLAHELHQRRGEAASRVIAGELVSEYHALSAPERTAFFEGLALELAPEPTGIDQAIREYQAAPDPASLEALAAAIEAPRRNLFRALNTAPNGTTTAVAMRADLLDSGPPPHLRPVARDLFHLLTSWFNPGFLDLATIDWKTPAHILEKLIEYEAVHEITGWDDLRRRLAPDRRCFGFFHPALGDEPVIFVEVALTEGMASSVQTLLDPSLATAELRDEADTAIFYSITNCQPGLRGISFGDFLIKGVVDLIRQDLPQITRFATLSPIPGLNGWLAHHASTEANRAIEAATAASADDQDSPDFSAARHLEPHRRELLGLAGRYLDENRPDGTPIDAVARFHQRNGAWTDRINWLGDTSTKGLAESAGMLVNYVYV